MKKIVTLSCFIRAHLSAQVALVKYYGGNGKIDEIEECELGRCILQSQVSTYKALTEAAHTQHQLGPELFKELQTLYKRKKITEGLSNFVLGAHHDCAISAFEAHKILHPLHDHVAECMYTLNQRADGVLDLNYVQSVVSGGSIISARLQDTPHEKPTRLGNNATTEMLCVLPNASFTCDGQEVPAE